ncbi:extracellular solute-binding protein [Hydrogenispora ethanolica]|jgi:putative aldouronate transport system substrate-binding protein|nr:extracellular solute-binding protein [Hydrogenispora ethanolica]
MKRDFRKLFLVMLAGLFVISMAWGAPGSFAKEKRIKINWVPYSIQPTDPNGEILKWIEEKFNADIDVWNMDESKFDEMVSLRMAAGEIPDFFRISKVANLGNYVNQGVAAVIPNGYLKKYAPNIYKCIQENAPGFMDYGRINGKMYGIPIVSPTNIFHLPLVYREDWLKKVGVAKAPETLAEFEKLMYKFAKEDPDGNGKKDTYGLSNTGMAAVFGAFGVPLNRWAKDDYFVKRGNRILNAAVAPELKSALALLHKWYQDGVLDPEFITGENTGGYWALSHAFINSRIGFSCSGNYYHWIPAGDYSQVTPDGKKIPCDPGAIAKEIGLVNPAMKYAFGMPLQGPNGQRGIFQFNRLMNFYAFGKQVEKDRAKMARILQIFDFASASPDLDQRYRAQWGIQGKHWVWVDKEHEEKNFLPPYDKQDGYNHRLGACLWSDMPFPPKQMREQWAYQHGLNKYGIESVIQFSLPSMVKYGAQLLKMRDQMLISIITGDKPVEWFDQYVKDYMRAGGAEVEKEVNQWYKANHKK